MANLKHVEIYADGADFENIVLLSAIPEISGFTTNPTLMHHSGVSDYEAFARKVIQNIGTRPISFEIFAEDHIGMIRQAHHISSWAPNVFVKVPVIDTWGQSTSPVVKHLTAEGIQVNVTAVMTVSQVEQATAALEGTRGAVVSVFAGRIADTGRDPIPIMASALDVTSAQRNVSLLWASPREILNVRQADDLGVDIITLSYEMLSKLSLFEKPLEQYSLETVRMFHRDAQAAGLTL